MASKAMLFLLATLLLVTTKVSQGEIVVPPKTNPPKAPTVPVVKPPPVSTAPPYIPPVSVPPPQTPVSKPPPVVSVPPTPTYNPPPAAPVNPPVTPPTPTLPPIKSLKECGPLCDTRCSLHSRKNVCTRACRTCCYRCRCVPPGTYGNQEMCGICYSRMKTSRNRFKCP